MHLNRKSWFFSALLAALAITAPFASAKNLGVNLKRQLTTDTNGNRIGDNWCWAACSYMILEYYGYPQTIFSIVDYGLGSSTYDTGNYMDGASSESRSDVLVWEEKPAGTFTRVKKTINPLVWKGIGPVIQHFSNDDVQAQYWDTAISADQVTKEINDNDAPFVRNVYWAGNTGAHVSVVYGTDGSNLSVHDPWFGDYISSDAVMRSGRIREAPDKPWSSYTWANTLTTSKILDVVFLFDTTGSMGSYLSNAKANASALLDKVASKFKNYRVAVANYKDYPESPYGGSSDYVYRSNQVFTNDKATAQGGINAVPSAGGGGDTPESVYSALWNVLQGNGIGAWRPDPCRRLIILIGDAPGHDPEPFPFGHSFGEIASIATNPDFPISVHCLWAGTSIDAKKQFSLISGRAGGSVVQSSSGSETTAGLNAIVQSVAESPRFPKGETAAIYPAFTFDAVGAGGMFKDATGLLLELQKFDTKKDAWKKVRLTSIKDPTAKVYQSTKPLAQGEYRWRLGFKRPATNLYLPSLADETETEVNGAEVGAPGEPDPKRKGLKVKAAVSFEPEYTEFTRVENLPARPTRLTPSTSSFTATDAKVEFTFGTVPGATSYVLQILQGSKVLKKLALKPPAKDRDVASLTKTIGGFKSGESYSWRVQALNYDRPKVDDAAW